MLQVVNKRKEDLAAASADELTKIAMSIFLNDFGKADQLLKATYQTDISTLDAEAWGKIRHLSIMGDQDEHMWQEFPQQGFRAGAYLNKDGDWLMLIFPKEHVQDILRRCGAKLEVLLISETEITTLFLHGLPQLQGLYVWCNDELTTIVGLEYLDKLTCLDIFMCENLEALPELGSLQKLTQLDICSCDQLFHLPGLDKLANLLHLKLECENLTELPDLGGLSNLRFLDLTMCRALTELPGVEQLTELVELDCSYAGIRFRQDAVFPPNLETLDLDSTPNTKIPDSIRTLKSLRLLILRGLHLEEIPEWLPEIAEGFSRERYMLDAGENGALVNLYETTAEGVDMSIFDQPYEMVVKWFEERRLGKTQPLNEIKVVFLGDGEAGKSHTIARLINDGGEPDTQIFDGQSTPGIVIRNKEYDLDGRTIQVHYWDFGGQEIMHSMHRIFLTGRTMYVILLNARDDTQGDRARYWLHNIKSFAPKAPVLLVLNKIDQNENASVDEKDLRGRYEKLTQVVRMSALNFSQEEFNASFTRVLLDEIKKTGFLDAAWPASWTHVKKKLEDMTTHYIFGEDYQKLCKDCRVDDNEKNLLHWFNDLGVSFCCCDEEDYALEDYVILRPDWITNALYIILFNKRKGVQNGLIPHESIYRLLRNAHSDPDIRCTLPQARYSTGDIQYVLGVMRKFNLSFPHGTEHEFIPMLCQQNSTVDIRYYQKDADILEFYMEFDYLPNNLIHRLMVERHAELDMDNVWRTGARFQLPELGLSAVVVIDGNILRFFIRHTDPMHRPNTYLAILKSNVDRIVKKMGLKAPDSHLVYKIRGKQAQFKYERLLKMHARGKKEEYCEDLDEEFQIEDILNQSAPAASENLNTLLDGIISACLHLQGNKNYRGWDENGRNSVVRDSLADKGYLVFDQTMRGTSESGKSYGELDLLIQRVPNRPWVLCEALIATGYTQRWNTHLGKLMRNYNPHGLSDLILLTYVDCEKDKFGEIWKKYRKHIQEDAPESFTCMPETVAMDLCSEYEYIRIARCNYRSGAYTPTLYHIFVQMDPKPEAE